jgi:glycine C-acetyltransferase
MKVLLVRPPVPRHTIGLKHVMICEPLELEYVAAGIPGAEVEILDMILESQFERKLQTFQPDVIGLSCYITGVNEVIKLCRRAKSVNPRVTTIVGGVQASIAPEDFADYSVDAIALGDGTSLMPLVLEALTNGESLGCVPGLALPINQEEVVRTQSISYMRDPDSLPFPRRDLLTRLSHRYYYLFHQPVALVKTTWGCWYDCKFCMTWRITGGHTFSRSPESIVDELERLESKDIYIVDDIFLTKPKRLSETAALMRRRGINKRFLVYGRADFIAGHEELIREWADIGLVAVIVGLEATTNRELKSMNKNCSVDENRLAVEVLRQNRIDTYASLIPDPEYTSSDWQRLGEFIDSTELYYVNVSPLTPFPGTDTWAEYKDTISVDRKAHGLWDLSHCVIPTHMPLKKYYRNLLRTYARTVLSMRRAGRVTFRTRPPLWSRKYLRLWWGAFRIFLQFVLAYRHHSESEISLAKSRGPEVKGLKYSGAEISMNNSTNGSNVSKPMSDQPSVSHIRRKTPGNVFGGFFNGKFDYGALHPLATGPAARRWFDAIRWGIPLDVYTFQQPLQGKSGRTVSINDESFVMMSSYDYLGLIGHPEIEKATIDAVQRYGTGAGGVRLLTGTTELHQQLEQEIAAFKGTEMALTYSSGYIANVAAISTLMQPSDQIVIDSRVHRSILDACRLSRVPIFPFKHNDCNSLEDKLRAAGGAGRTLIVVEGVYSMDGDICPLPEIVSLKNRYDAFLMVDEAHSLGVLGKTGRGVNEHYDIPAEEVDIWMGTLSKAIPSTGGYVAGRRDIIILLQHASAPFMFSAGCAPPTVAAASAGLKVVQSEPDRLDRLRANSDLLRKGLNDLNFDTGESQSPIVPVILGSDESAYRMGGDLFSKGIVALAVVSPAVKRGKARLRLCASAGHDRDVIDSVLREFAACKVGALEESVII